MRIFLTALAVLLFATPAAAGPGSVDWLNLTGSGNVDVVTTAIRSGQTIQIQFLVGSSNSKLFTLGARNADVCFDPDTLSSGGTARITLYRAIALPANDNARITLPAIPFNGTDCFVITLGRYWFEITTAATGSENAIVTVTGR